jgi:hypothetical protein
MPSFFPTLSFPMHPLIPLSSLYFLDSLYPLLSNCLLSVSSLYFRLPESITGTLSAPSIIPLFTASSILLLHPNLPSALYPSPYLQLPVSTAVPYPLPVSSLRIIPLFTAPLYLPLPVFSSLVSLPLYQPSLSSSLNPLLATAVTHAICFLPPNVLSLYPLPLFSPVSPPLY